jgi:NAD(P)-dependent dehydrogenase (short-subunit alcohol dehydrogenase family)
VDARTLFDLSGRVALVAGGSRGLGREIVLAFAAAGADVVIASRRLESCEQVAAEVRTTTGRRALPVACHIGRWDEVNALADTAYNEFGTVDVLVNSAGMSPLYDRLADVTEEMWDKVLGVNLKGVFRLTALVGTRMAEGAGGSVINISSVAAWRPAAEELPYSAAKGGVHQLTLGFAHAFAPKVRVNCIVPGPFLTDISKAWSPEFLQGLSQTVCFGRPGNPEEIVGAALYLATDASSYTTGALLGVHGGSW